MESLSDPESLRDREDVAFDEQSRSIDRETFEALRERYDAIDGVVQVGVTSDDGAVLLWGPDGWAPPGGDVEPGEDWAAAARRAIEELAGVSVDIDGPELVERIEFGVEDEADSRFPAYNVLFGASLPDDTGPADVEVVDDLDHPYFDDGTDLELAWFDEVPEDAHANHEDHVRLFLD